MSTKNSKKSLQASSTKGSISKENLMDMAPFSTQMERSMKDPSSKDKRKGKAYSEIRQEGLSVKLLLRMMFKMGKERKLGNLKASSKVNISMGSKMALVRLLSQIIPAIVECGKLINIMVKVSSLGKMAPPIRDNGSMDSWKVLVP